MKIVFAGPTLRGIDRDAFPSLDFRPPAQRGDVIAAVRDGATMIGLIDGVFERMPSVWHKEILFALSEGVGVLGAASMGALRAAECHAFGMIGIGDVFEAYANGTTEDDEDVAQLHAPQELDYLPLSEPLVNIRATLRHVLTIGFVTASEYETLIAAAQALFFKDRTFGRIVETSDLPLARKADVAGLLKLNSINVKQQDAKQLLLLLESGETPAKTDIDQFKWRLARTRSLHYLLLGEEGI